MSLDLSALLGRTAPMADSPSNALKPERIVLPPDPMQSAQRNADNRRVVTATVIRPDGVSDITGGTTAVHKIMAAYTIGIMKNTSKFLESEGVDVAESVGDVRLFFPLNADIQTADRVGVPGWFDTWKPNTNYAVGKLIIPSRNGGNGHCYVVTKVGQSAATEPSLDTTDWPVQRNASIVNGTVTFREAGDAEFFEVVGHNKGITSNTLELVVDAKVVR